MSSALMMTNSAKVVGGGKISKKSKKEDIVMIDVSKEHIINIQDKDLEEYKRSICDLAFVIDKGESNCTMLRTQNRCPWKPIGDEQTHSDEVCQERQIDAPDTIAKYGIVIGVVFIICAIVISVVFILRWKIGRGAQREGDGGEIEV